MWPGRGTPVSGAEARLQSLTGELGLSCRVEQGQLPL